jgi:hypothetical protein
VNREVLNEVDILEYHVLPTVYTTTLFNMNSFINIFSGLVNEAYCTMYMNMSWPSEGTIPESMVSQYRWSCKQGIV